MNNAEVEVQKVIYKNLFLPGTELKYNCDDGYIMAPEYYVGVVCGEDGNYTALSTVPGFTTGACLPGSVNLLQFSKVKALNYLSLFSLSAHNHYNIMFFVY